MAVDAELAKRFARTFRGRTDAWGAVNGQCVHEAVKLGHYQRHLAGKTSLGVYPLDKDGIVYWSAIDIDQPDYQKAREVRSAYQAMGYPAYVERSKSMHYHVWSFFAGLPAGKARALAKQVLFRCDLPLSTELFPKQDALRPGGFGNYINLPYFGLNGKARVFLDDAGEPIDLESFLASVETIQALPDIPEPEKREPRRSLSREMGTGDYTGPDPQCIRAALSYSASKGERHAVGTRLAGYFLNTCGKSEDDTLEIIMGWNAGNAPPLSLGALTDCVERMRGYAWGCDGLREFTVFENECVGSSCWFHKVEVVPASEPAQPQPDPGNELALCYSLTSTGFLRDYLGYACALTDAPRIFHLASALTLIATALGNRVHCLGYGGRWVFPNVWLCLVAGSGFYRKSTAMSIAKEIQSRAIPGAALSEDASREQWISELAERSDRILYSDEFSTTLASWENKYMMGTKGLFTSLYDLGRYVRSIRGNKDPIEIDNPAVTLLAGSTKDWLLDTVKPVDFRSGFLARMMFIAGTHKEPRVVGVIIPDAALYDELVERVRAFSRLQGEIHFSDVQDAYDKWLIGFEDRFQDNMEPAVSGVISRAGVTVRKLAMIFHVAQADRGNPMFHVSEDSLEKAIRFVEWVIARQLWLIKEEFALTPFDQQRHRVLELLKADKSHAMQHRELLRATRWSLKDFAAVIDNLLETGDIMSKTEERGGLGRPAKVYTLTHAFGHNGYGEA